MDYATSTMHVLFTIAATKLPEIWILHMCIFRYLCTKCPSTWWHQLKDEPTSPGKFAVPLFSQDLTEKGGSIYHGK